MGTFEPIRQSSISSFSRCPQQFKLSREMAQTGRRERNLSATVFGTVMHHCLHLLQIMFLEERPDAVEQAVRSFEHYWHPDNIEHLAPGGVDVWLPRQTYAGLLIRGRDNLRTYGEHLAKDTGKLLAVEVMFRVPIEVMGRRLEATGTLDRLVLRARRGQSPYLSIEDFKTGAKPTYLRHAFQWTYYSWATCQPAFWDQWPREDLYALVEPLHAKGYALFADDTGFPVIPRRGRWIAVRDTFGVHDAGWRTGTDFARMKVALHEYVASVEANIFPLNIAGTTCTYCPFAYDGSCGGISLESFDEGEPYTASELGEVSRG